MDKNMESSNNIHIDALKCSPINKNETRWSNPPNQGSYNLWKYKSHLSKSNMNCSDEFYRKFACLSLVLIFFGVVIICTCVLTQVFDPGYNKRSEIESWSSWSSWSKCDKMTLKISRNRTCNLDIISHKKCFGPYEEFIKCEEFYPPELNVKGEWSEWSKWSSCSQKCQDTDGIPLQSRFRSCWNKILKKEINSCTGSISEYRFCSWLKTCQKSQWSEWTISEKCHTKEEQVCGPGLQTLKRKCLTNEKCIGNNISRVDCWSHINCPVSVQPPRNIELTSDGNGNFNISWSIVPYGEISNRVRIYLTMNDKNKKELKTLSQEVVINFDLVKEQKYGIHVNLTEYLFYEKFHSLSIRLLSLNYKGSQSKFTIPISSESRAVDGQWESWGYWSDCSTTCSGRQGIRTRTRQCNQPPPSNNGKTCPGSSKDDIDCLGMEEDNCL